MECRVHAVKNNSGLPALKPGVIHVKCERVTTCRVFLRHKRRVNGNGIGDIGIDGRVEPLHLPVRRHGHRDGIRAIFADPCLRNLLGCRKVAKSPHPVKRAPADRSSVISGGRFITPAVQRRVCGQAVPLGNAGVFPVPTGQDVAEGQRGCVGHSNLFAKRSQFWLTCPGILRR